MITTISCVKLQYNATVSPMGSQRKASVNECGEVCMCEPLDVSEASIRDYYIHI